MDETWLFNFFFNMLKVISKNIFFKQKEKKSKVGLIRMLIECKDILS